MNETSLNYDGLIKMTKMYVPINAVEIRVTNHLPTETVQVKRHKRKSSRRWQKKWLKRFGTKQVVKNEIYQIGNMILISPEMNKKLMDRIRQTNRDFERQQFERFWNGTI